MIRVIDATDDETSIQTCKRTYVCLKENRFRRDAEELEKERQRQENKAFFDAIKAFVVPIAIMAFAVFIITFYLNK